MATVLNSPPPVRTRKSSPCPLVDWVDRPTADYPFGVVRVRIGKETAFYDIAEVACDFPNCRGFHLTKHANPLSSSYDVCLCMVNPQDHTCECKGFLAHGHCCHLAAAALFAQTPLPIEVDHRPVPADAPF